MEGDFFHIVLLLAVGTWLWRNMAVSIGDLHAHLKAWGTENGRVPASQSVSQWNWQPVYVLHHQCQTHEKHIAMATNMWALLSHMRSTSRELPGGFCTSIWGLILLQLRYQKNTFSICHRSGVFCSWKTLCKKVVFHHSTFHLFSTEIPLVVTTKGSETV